MSYQLSEELNAAFGDTKKFHALVDSNWPEIDKALKGYDYACRVVDFGYRFGTFDFSVLKTEAVEFVEKQNKKAALASEAENGNA